MQHERKFRSMSHYKDTKNQCERINEMGERCVNTAKLDSIYCRRCELIIQKEHNLLEYPRQDFFQTHKPYVYGKPLTLIFFLVLSLYILPSALSTSYSRITELIKLQFTAESLLVILVHAIRGISLIAMCFYALCLLRAEFANTSEGKYLHRTRSYKLIGLVIFPLSITYFFVLLLIGHLVGWDKATSSNWFAIIGLIMSIIISGIFFIILRKPLLYFQRGFSLLFDLTFLIGGVFMVFQSIILDANSDNSLIKITGLITISFGVRYLLRTIAGKETVLQQIIAQIYRLPDLLQNIVSSDQRRLALAIGLGQFQNLTSLQREELIKHLVERHKPSTKEKIVSTLKFVIVTFIVALLIESPASYIFDKIVKSFQNK